MMTSGTFSRLLAPGLRKIFHTAYNELPEVWTQFFDMQNSTKAYEEDFSWAGFDGPFQEFGELEHIQLRDAVPGLTTKYVHRKWGLGYQLSQELIDDNQYGSVLSLPEMLARQARATKEVSAASIFNLGFSADITGANGEPLFSTNHPLLAGGGATQSNTFTTPRDLSYASLKEALTFLKRNKADDGIFAPIIPRILLVPDSLEFTANEILGSEQVPYSADNTVNVLRNKGLQIVTWSYLNNDNNWFLLADRAQTHLNYFERWPLRQLFKDREENQSMLHLSFYRSSWGWSHHTGVFGVQGGAVV